MDANRPNKDGATPLLIAAHKGHAGVVAELLAAPQGVDVNRATSRGHTPFDLAVLGRHAASPGIANSLRLRGAVRGAPALGVQPDAGAQPDAVAGCAGGVDGAAAAAKRAARREARRASLIAAHAHAASAGPAQEAA